jgi:hypothetical protein
MAVRRSGGPAEQRELIGLMLFTIGPIREQINTSCGTVIGS